MTLPSPWVTSSEEIMSGAVVFAGTRVPVQTLMDYLEEDGSLDEFLEDFPTVSREHADQVLELAELDEQRWIFESLLHRCPKAEAETALKKTLAARTPPSG